MSFLLFQHRSAESERWSSARAKGKATKLGIGRGRADLEAVDPSEHSPLAMLEGSERIISESERSSPWVTAIDSGHGVFMDRRASGSHICDVCRSFQALVANPALSPLPEVVSIKRDLSSLRTRAQVGEHASAVAPKSRSAQQVGAVPFKLTIVVPVYNEEGTIGQVLEALIAQSIPGDFEIIVVDDGSTDCTKEMLQASWNSKHVNIRHETNRGKGAAVRTGISRATGTHLLVFDADSEYDPADIPKLIAPILSGRAEIVYGVRVRGAGALFPSFINLLGNRLMTTAANLLYGSAISDLHTCLKLLPLPLLRLMPLEEEGFGLDTEVSAELLRRGFRPFEVPVSYVGRSREEGKKIRVADAFQCLEVLVKVRLRGRTHYGIRDRSIVPRVSAATSSEAEMLSEVANAVDM